MKKSLSILAGAVMSLMVVTGYAQNINDPAVPNASSMNDSEEANIRSKQKA